MGLDVKKLLCEYFSKEEVQDALEEIGEPITVTASEAEEVLGKGAEYNPIGHITLGFPYFSRAAIKNTKNTKITLLKVSVIGEMLIKYWQNSISVNEIIDLLLSGTSIDDSLSKEKSLVD